MIQHVGKSLRDKEMGNDWAEYFLNMVVNMNLIENSSFTVLYQNIEEHVYERYLKREIGLITVEHENTSRYPKCTKRSSHWLYSPFRIYQENILLTDQHFISIYQRKLNKIQTRRWIIVQEVTSILQQRFVDSKCLV